MSNYEQRDLTNLKIWVNDVEINKKEYEEIWYWLLDGSNSYDSCKGIYSNYDDHTFVFDFKYSCENAWLGLNEKTQELISKVEEDDYILIKYSNVPMITYCTCDDFFND